MNVRDLITALQIHDHNLPVVTTEWVDLCISFQRRRSFTFAKSQRRSLRALTLTTRMLFLPCAYKA